MPEDPLNTTPPPATDAPPATPVSPDAIEAANVANILGQLAAGKPITAAQQKLVTDYQRRQLAQEPPAPAPATPAPARHRSSAAFTDQVADTLTAAAAMSGFSEENLTRAKAAGCPAFRGSRVYLSELVSWFDANPEVLTSGDSELDGVTLQIAREKHRKIRFENDCAEGRYVLAADVAPQIEQWGRELVSILRRMLEDEAPDRQAMRPAPELRVINRGIVDAITDEVRAGARKIFKR